MRLRTPPAAMGRSIMFIFAVCFTLVALFTAIEHAAPRLRHEPAYFDVGATSWPVEEAQTPLPLVADPIDDFFLGTR
jgi:hypothetical protein